MKKSAASADAALFPYSQMCQSDLVAVGVEGDDADGDVERGGGEPYGALHAAAAGHGHARERDGLDALCART